MNISPLGRGHASNLGGENMMWDFAIFAGAKGVV